MLEVFGEHTLEHARDAGAAGDLRSRCSPATGCTRRGRTFPLLRLSLFRIRTFRAAVSGSFFTRLGSAAFRFCFRCSIRWGWDSRPIQSGLLMMPQAIAAMSLKLTMPGFWRASAIAPC